MTSSPAPQALPRRQILIGDALTRLHQFPDGQIDCIVTSPPYFRLRDYGHAGQLGMEGDATSYVDNLRTVCRELARVIVPGGTLWLNLGDTYSLHPQHGAARKSLLGVPERVLLALMEDGWLVRNKIIWAKTNPIPSPVTDRLACTYEVIYLLVRSPHYFFDLDSVRQPHTSQRRPSPRGRALTRPPARRDPNRPGWRGPNAVGDGGLTRLRDLGLPGHPLGKNPGDVWHLATSRYRGAHFATYPEALVERMLRAGCPEARCRACLTAWRRPVHRLGAVATRAALRARCHCDAPQEPGLVLDPFLGAGTTAVVAEWLGRDWVGIELNPDYARQAEERLAEARRHSTSDAD